MRHVLRVLVAVTSVLTVASPALAGPRPFRRRPIGPTSSGMLYATSLSDFVAAVGGDHWFDWSTDFCSAPLVGNTGRSFNFTNAVPPARLRVSQPATARPPLRPPGLERHQSASGSISSSSPTCRRHCRSRPWYDEPTCFAWATTFYAARPGRPAGRDGSSQRGWLWAVDAQGHPQQLMQHPRGRTPDRLVVEFEEEDRAMLAVRSATTPRERCRRGSDRRAAPTGSGRPRRSPAAAAGARRRCRRRAR